MQTLKYINIIYKTIITCSAEMDALMIVNCHNQSIFGALVRIQRRGLHVLFTSQVSSSCS